MAKKQVTESVARKMMSYYIERITHHFGYVRDDLDALSKFASIIYGAPLVAYLCNGYEISFTCTDPSSPKYTDKDLTLEDIL